ncbi:MAG TPA: TetR/AcrR family transcriptional regulator [Acidimicrobiales bacterium]
MTGGNAAEARASETTMAGRWVRKSPEARRADILASAREVFVARGYAESGIAEVAAEAQVSKSLLYHYFPGGRSQLFVQIVEEVLGELTDALRHARRTPFSPRVRLTHLLSALFTFFTENPAAYRLLFRDPAVSHDPAVEAAALTVRAQIAAEFAAVLAETDLPPDDVVAASGGILGFALANVELCLDGRLDHEHAWTVTCAFCVPPVDAASGEA